MTVPQFLLMSESSQTGNLESGGRWRFVLEQLNGDWRLEATDREDYASSNRLELLAVVRGLESLDQESKITLVTRNRYISRAVRVHLADWRENNWRWERYEALEPIKNDDLWKRVDRALKFHQLDCRIWRFDEPHNEVAQPHVVVKEGDSETISTPERKKIRTRGRRPVASQENAEQPSYGWIRRVARDLCHRSGRKLTMPADRSIAATR